MSASQTFGFAKLVPGFDFLQNLAQGGSGAMPPMTPLSSWVAPTLNVEELEKRIQELRAVHFWLEQNGKALGATIQALEVQKMTLSTLQGMNLNMAELAESLQLRPETLAGFTGLSAGASAPADKPAAPAPGSRAPAKTAREGKDAASKGPGPKEASSEASAAPGNVDPMQWWGALSQQFQQIASTALKDVAQAGAAPAGAGKAPASQKAGRAAKARGTSTAQTAAKAASNKASKTGAQAPARAAPVSRAKTARTSTRR